MIRVLFVCHGMVLTNGQKSFIFKRLTEEKNEFITSLQLLNCRDTNSKNEYEGHLSLSGLGYYKMNPSQGVKSR